MVKIKKDKDGVLIIVEDKGKYKEDFWITNEEAVELMKKLNSIKLNRKVVSK